MINTMGNCSGYIKEELSGLDLNVIYTHWIHGHEEEIGGPKNYIDSDNRHLWSFYKYNKNTLPRKFTGDHL